jgi:parvulin-like peptidyl-prolyl isomerase
VPPLCHPEGVPYHPQEKTTLKKSTFALIACSLIISLFACGGKREANPAKSFDEQVKVLATVNGVPITEYDVRQGFQRVAHGETVNPQAIGNILQSIVQNELVYQKAVELGLDNNPGYQGRLHEAQAHMRAMQRQEMSFLYREHIKNQAVVTDAEAQDYFQKNSSRIRTKYHLLQIYYKGNEARIVQDHKEIRSGKSFEKVAAKRFQGLPRNMNSPWDLGYMHWNQVPPAWQAALDRLEPGKVSDIIKGPGERFWVIKLVDKKVDPAITFAAEKEKIVEALKRQKAEALHESLLGEIKAKSKIVYAK